MANEFTQLGDIIDPELYYPYSLQRAVELSRLFQSGVVLNTEQMDAIAKQAGTTANLPFWNDFDGDSEPTPDGPEQEADKITTGRQTAHKHLRQKSWGRTDNSADVAGSDPMTGYVEKTARWWNRDMQKQILVPTLKGVFDDGDSPLRSGGAADHVHDIAVESTGAQTAASRISVEAVVNAVTYKLGDHGDSIRAICMHSGVYGRLQIDGQITFERFEDQDITIPRFAGLEVIVDDGVPTVAGTTDGIKYTSYLFGEGAFGFGEGAPDTPVEFERVGRGALEYLIVRRNFYMHPAGFRFTGTPAGVSPTATELEDGTSWTLSTDHKTVPLAKLVTN